jgi:hypothetical protein
MHNLALSLALQLMTAAAAEQMLFEIGRSEPQDEGSKKQASKLRETSGVAGATAAGLSGLGLFQVARGNVLGSAVEHLTAKVVTVSPGDACAQDRRIRARNRALWSAGRKGTF